MEMNVLVTLEPDVAGGFVGGEMVEDDVDFALPDRRRRPGQ